MHSAGLPRAHDFRCLSCPVHHHAVCKALGPNELHELHVFMTHRHLKAQQVLAIEGDKTASVAIIVSGLVKLSRMMSNGREHIVALHKPGDLVGCTEQEENHETVTCLTDVEVCCFRKEPFDAFAHAHPELERQLLSHCARHLDEARDWLSAIGQKSATQRVATFLLWLRGQNLHPCEQARDLTDAAIVGLPLRREEIGAFLGLTIETVSRNLGRLKADGVIDFKNQRTIIIRDLEHLKAIADPAN